MPKNILLSGPAGAGKSQRAREIMQESTEPVVAADFQSIVSALLLQERGPDGTYPVRPDWVLPLAEYTRRSVITGARRAGIKIIGTNSDGDPDRRNFLLDELSTDEEEAEEILIELSEEEAKKRLRNKRTGRLSRACTRATDRWFRRYRRR